jgi:hypothetical protein
MFLGRKVQIEALVCELSGKRYVMPRTVGECHPHDAMAEGSLRLIMSQAFPRAEVVIPPPVTLLDSEAMAFLVDFAQQDAPEPVISGEITAQAAGKVFEE